MKRLALALVLAGMVAGGARADGGGGDAWVLIGRQGVTAPDGSVRYVALTTGRQTIVSVVRVRGGQVVRWRLLRGYLGVPVVTLDGRPQGVSDDGTTLVLAEPAGGVATSFALVDTRTLRLRLVRLRGSWSYDAISPDGSLLYLVEYLGVGPSAPYRVRAYDLGARRLVPEPIVDRREREAQMRGRPVTRVASPDGRWAYTLYARARKEPFLHALDTVGRAAYCVDLPVELRLAAQLRLRLGLSADRLLVRSHRGPVVVVDTETFEVREP